MPRVGKRVVVSQFAENPVEALEKYVSLVDMDEPDPRDLGPLDVRIDVKAAAVGWVDLLMTSGQYQHMPSPPYTPGLEYSGVVSWVGSKVVDVGVGDRVFVDPFLAGPRSLGKYQRWGGFASFAVASAEAVYRMPEGFSFEQACSLLGNYETAYHCLIARGRLRAGETVLINGASGSTGLAAVHVAKLVGARVIATGRSDEKLAVVRGQGADHVINCRSVDPALPLRSFRDEVKALTGGKGVDVVYDGVGGDVSLESLRCVRFGARFLIVGWASTPAVAKGKGERGAPGANQLPTNLVMMKGLDVLGCPTAISTAEDPSIRTERLEAIFGWVASGKLKPYVSHRFSVAEFRQAMQAKWDGVAVGGCVLRD